MSKYYLWYDKNNNNIYPSDSLDFNLDSPDVYKDDNKVVFFDTLEEQVLFMNQNFKEETIPFKYRRTDWNSLKKKML